MSRRVLGAMGFTGWRAGAIVVIRTADERSASCGDSSGTASASWSLMPSAISRARSGEVSLTAISMTTVLSGVLTLTLRARRAGVVSSPRSSITGSSTYGDCASTAYDATRFCT